MNKLTDIIDLLTNSRCDLSEALLKTKVLAFKLENQPLLTWIKNEYDGYQDDDEIPEYRTLTCMVKGTIKSFRDMATNFTLPVDHLPDNVKKWMSEIKMGDSIAALQALVEKEGEAIKFAIPSEFYNFFEGRMSGNYAVLDAYRLSNTTQIIQIISTVRSKLLDFLLAIEHEIGDDIKSMSQDRGNIKTAADLFQNTVFGDNATIIIGSSNKQRVNNSIVKKGDFQALRRRLIENEVQEDDINKLKVVIDSDDENEQKRTFGMKVNAWIKSMISKSIDASWKVGIASSGKLLADVISEYYGWNH